jgi:hypothetical protein
MQHGHVLELFLLLLVHVHWPRQEAHGHFIGRGPIPAANFFGYLCLIPFRSRNQLGADVPKCDAPPDKPGNIGIVRLGEGIEDASARHSFRYDTRLARWPSRLVPSSSKDLV